MMMLIDNTVIAAMVYDSRFLFFHTEFFIFIFISIVITYFLWAIFINQSCIFTKCRTEIKFSLQAVLWVNCDTKFLHLLIFWGLQMSNDMIESLELSLAKQYLVKISTAFEITIAYESSRLKMLYEGRKPVLCYPFQKKGMGFFSVTATEFTNGMPNSTIP